MAWIQAGGIGNHDSHYEFEAVGSRNKVPDGQLGGDRGLRGRNNIPRMNRNQIRVKVTSG